MKYIDERMNRHKLPLLLFASKCARYRQYSTGALQTVIYIYMYTDDASLTLHKSPILIFSSVQRQRKQDAYVK